MGRLIPLLLISTIVFAYSYSYADEDHDKAYQLLRSGKVLSLEEILGISRQHVQGKILEVELEQEDKQLIYELEILDDKGIVWKLKVDARTGTLIKKEQD